MIDPHIEAHIRADAYARTLGAIIEAIEPGYSRVSLVITPELLNFHGMTHGGVVFSLADIAFAAAGNSHGQTAVALNVNINFTNATQVGAHLMAEAREVSLGRATGLYEIAVTERESGQLVAQCLATVYRKREFFGREML